MYSGTLTTAPRHRDTGSRNLTLMTELGHIDTDSSNQILTAAPGHTGTVGNTQTYRHCRQHPYIQMESEESA